jgi:hypothetical protein
MAMSRKRLLGIGWAVLLRPGVRGRTLSFVDLTGIRDRLQALGVTLRFENDPPAIADLLHDQREYRAALYIDRLEAARTFLTTTLAGAAPPAGRRPPSATSATLPCPTAG